jgi:BirA family biotin operon repressor/biotin-[acetyl-CoA-carboxylase] ligase
MFINLINILQNNIFLALFVGHSLVKLHEVDSTNTYLKDLLSNSKPLIEGTVIMADYQTSGRGQKDNVWESEKGANLTFSVLFRPSFLDVNQQFQLNKAISLGVSDVLIEILGESSKIKWPNDIYFQDKKIGGILIENTIKGNFLKESIVGIGLNVNQKEFGLNNNRATSLSKILHQDYHLDKLLSQLCNRIESRYLQLKAGKNLLLNIDYLDRLFRLNELHRYEIDNQNFKGIIKGVTPTGRLTIQLSDGKQMDLDLKEVKFIYD